MHLHDSLPCSSVLFFFFLKFYFLVSLISTEVEQKQLKVKIVVVSAE